MHNIFVKVSDVEYAEMLKRKNSSKKTWLQIIKQGLDIDWIRYITYDECSALIDAKQSVYVTAEETKKATQMDSIEEIRQLVIDCLKNQEDLRRMIDDQILID